MGLECTHHISFEEPRIGSFSILIRLNSLASSLISNYGEMVITLDEGLTSLLGVTKITLMVPKGGHDVPHPFGYPSLTAHLRLKVGA